jgi:Rieske Fe-S protein
MLMTDRDSSTPEAPEDAVTPEDGSGVPDPDRRRFLVRTITAIGGGITAAIGVPAVIYATGSARAGGGEQEWIRLGTASSVEVGAAPVLMKATVERRSGYRVEEQEISVFVTTEDGSTFRVLSNICTHLGCRVRWVDEQDGFFCPCHNAIFGPDGGVVQGPPPRPLDSYEFLVEEGQLYFREV